MAYDPWQDEPRYRFTRTYANALIALGVCLWILTVAIGAAVSSVDLQRVVTVLLQRLPPEDFSFRWTDIPLMILALLFGGILSSPLILGGQLCKLLLAQRDAHLALGKRIESLGDELAKLNRDFLERHARIRARAESAERDSERLRDEVIQLHAEIERHRREQQELAEALSRIIGETLLRLRGRQA